jgi:hypothetical protein
LRRAITPFRDKLRPHPPLNDSLLDVVALLEVELIDARTVNLSHVGAHIWVLIACRRRQRFFQHVEPGPDWSARLIARPVGLNGSWHLALDRTQWQGGACNVDVLLLAAITQRLQVALIWTGLDHRGCSDPDSGSR